MNRENFAGRPSRPRAPSSASADLREFWETAPLRSRIALACAGVSALAWLASFAGVMRHAVVAGVVMVTMHLLIMALFLWNFARLWVHHRTWWKSRATGVRGPRQPRVLLWAAALSAALLLMGFVLGFGRGEGAPAVRDGRDVWVNRGEVVRPLAPGERDTIEAEGLRLLAAAWMFFSLTIALTGRSIEHRIEEMRDG